MWCLSSRSAPWNMQCFFPTLTFCPLYGSKCCHCQRGCYCCCSCCSGSYCCCCAGLARLDFLCNLRLGVLINAASLHVWGRLSMYTALSVCVWVCVHGSVADPLCRYRFIFINIFNFVQLWSFKVVNSLRNACVAMLALSERERELKRAPHIAVRQQSSHC